MIQFIWIEQEKIRAFRVGANLRDIGLKGERPDMAIINRCDWNTYFATETDEHKTNYLQTILMTTANQKVIFYAETS